MAQLWVFYEQTCQYFQLPQKKTELTIGNQLQHDITVQAFAIEPAISLVQTEDGNALQIYQDGQWVGEIRDRQFFQWSQQQHMLKMMYHKDAFVENTYYIGNQTEITLPTGEENEMLDTSITLFKAGDKWMVQPKTQDIYINGQMIHLQTALTCGDILFQSGIFVTLTEDDLLTIASAEELAITYPKTTRPTSILKQKYPAYRRTPRMIYELPDDKVSFSFPAPESENSQRALWLIIAPPLVMLIVMGVVALLIPRGIFIIISVAMFVTTLITSTVQYFKERARYKKREEQRRRLYLRYLGVKQEELHQLYEKQRDVLYYHFPSFERMKYLTAEISERIWERTLVSNDFLRFRVGRADVPSSYQVSVNQQDMSKQEVDDLLEKSQVLVDHYKVVKNVPLVINFAAGAMGMVGKHAIVINEIQQIAGQISFLHSYHDVRFVAIFDEAEYERWEWLKWLPHFQLPHLPAKGFVYNEQTRDQLLSSIYEILKERDLDSEKDKKLFAPHFIFIVTNPQLISEHSILEYLEGGQTNIGISTIFAADTKESLSENIQTLVRYIDENRGEILIRDKRAVHLPFWLDSHTSAGNERFSRTLRSLDHQLGMSNSIPEMVSFLQLFHADQASDLHISQRWQKNHSSKSLAVPIGLKGKDDAVQLNLHEKAHGPHGLLAGTTGSGKSEFLQTYILSLAVNFHPYEVAFLLIDYKGGGMAQPFKNMPHLLGTITNIEGSKNFSKRALASIKSELKRRQRLFDRYEVNHINDYMELYNEKIADQPLPHLFLISDEFAELKSEEPEFIRELISAARIGRSLGVHLILATQKPGGIIDDQIWSNSRFKVALKVQDESDSKEILKNADAAKLTVTGRGYLQVGNNEVYELFQSAWSGAPYVKEAFGAEDEVALVTDLGMVALSEVEMTETGPKEKTTEIDAVVEEIIDTQKRLHIEKLASPWLPPLPKRLAPPVETHDEPNVFLLGLVDEPELQRQIHYGYEAMEDGNVGIFGSSGYGKSMTMLSLLLRFAMENSPEEYQFYIFDFGNGALLPLQQLPHTADYFRTDDKRKTEKFFEIMHEEMAKRKQLFRDQEVSNINMYNTLASEPLPLIFITIDNFDLVKDEMLDAESQFIQIARDGQSLGIYTVLAATRTNAVKQALMSNLKTKIVHYLMDHSEKFSIIGRTPYEIEAIPGRAYIKKEDAYLVQMFLPADGETDVAVFENVKGCVQQLKKKYEKAAKPKAIPMLPRQLTYPAFLQNYGVVNDMNHFAIGLDENSVEPVYINWQKHKHCIIAGDAQKGKTNTLKLFIDYMTQMKKGKIALFDAINRSLSDYADKADILYMETKEQVADWMQETEAVFTEREEAYRVALNERRASSLHFNTHMLIVDGVGNFQQHIDKTMQAKLAAMIKNYSHLGFSFIATGSIAEITKGFDPLTSEMKLMKQIILLMRKSDQSAFTLPYTRNEPEIKTGFGYYVENGKAKKIQLPNFDAERVLMR